MFEAQEAKKMSKERHPINQCHYGAALKVLEEKIDWQNREISRITKQSNVYWNALNDQGYQEYDCADCQRNKEAAGMALNAVIGAKP